MHTCTLQWCMSPVSRCWRSKYPEAQLNPQELDCRVHKARWPGLVPPDLKSLSTRITIVNFIFVFPLSVIEPYCCELCVLDNMVILALHVAPKTKLTAVQFNHCNWFVRSSKIDNCPSDWAVRFYRNLLKLLRKINYKRYLINYCCHELRVRLLIG